MTNFKAMSEIILVDVGTYSLLSVSFENNNKTDKVTIKLLISRHQVVTDAR